MDDYKGLLLCNRYRYFLSMYLKRLHVFTSRAGDIQLSDLYDINISLPRCYERQP